MPSTIYKPIPQCEVCDAPFPDARAELKYTTCLPCGEKAARRVQHTIAPLAKSNYIHISDRALLTQLNPKRTT